MSAGVSSVSSATTWSPSDATARASLGLTLDREVVASNFVGLAVEFERDLLAMEQSVELGGIPLGDDAGGLLNLRAESRPKLFEIGLGAQADEFRFSSWLKMTVLIFSSSTIRSSSSRISVSLAASRQTTWTAASGWRTFRLRSARMARPSEPRS